MSFYDFTSPLNVARRQLRKKKLSDVDVIDAALDQLKERADDNQVLLRAMYEEMLWKLNRRPYYDLYPSVVDAFAHTKFDVPRHQIRCPLPAVLIRFPRGNPLQYDGHELRTALLVDEEKTQASEVAWLRSIGSDEEADQLAVLPKSTDLVAYLDYCFEPRSALPSLQSIRLDISEEGLLSDFLEELVDFEKDHPFFEKNTESARQLFRVIAAICLLGDNPDLIEPLVLDRDKSEYEKTHSPALVEKAVAAGKRGWAVGARITTAAGFRRPHFGWRHTGPGRTIPRLVPIKGCLVNRKKVTEVPTGYLDDLNIG